jgi:hypothetical protein
MMRNRWGRGTAAEAGDADVPYGPSRGRQRVGASDADDEAGAM